MSEQNDDSTTFLRQRRDLFVISAILLLLPLAEIQIKPNISMQQFGMSLEIGKPEVIYYSLWVLWAYWYIRYIQVYRALNQQYLSLKYHTEMASALFATFNSLASKKKVELINDGILAESSSFSFKNQSYRLLKSEYICEFSAYDPTYGGTSSPICKTLKYSGFRYLLLEIKVTFKFVIANIEVTEYLLPFIFGLSPLVYFLYRYICKLI